MKNSLKFFVFVILVIASSCSSSGIKEKINKTGDAAGQAIGEFASGVTTGVKKAIEPKIEINDNLKKKGLSFGKMTISSDSLSKDNILIAYTIFEVDYSGALTAKAFDNKGLEMGRAKVEIKGKKDETRFVEFHFDRRTEIHNDSKLTLE